MHSYIKADSLACLVRCGPGHPTMAVSHWKAWKSGSCSSMRLDVLTVPTCHWRIPGEMLVFSGWGRPKNVALIPVKECCSNRTGELACESEGKQAKTQRFFFHVLSSGLPQKIPSGSSSFKESDQGKPLKDCPVVCILAASSSIQVDKQG